jgi:predicted nuclease of predicted toxin-antitoxin system
MAAPRAGACVRLLLDEMISPRIARELRDRGHDVQAIKKDRPDLAGRSDREIVAAMALERRTLVTNDVADFQLIHDRMLAAGEEHAGMVFTFDASLPRNKAMIPLWVKRLEELLHTHEKRSLRCRAHHLR